VNALPYVDQRNTRTVDAGNRLDRELRHVTEYVDYRSGARHDPGDFVETGMQFGLV
jgi:hypothetical protein